MFLWLLELVPSRQIVYHQENEVFERLRDTLRWNWIDPHEESKQVSCADLETILT